MYYRLDMLLCPHGGCCIWSEIPSNSFCRIPRLKVIVSVLYFGAAGCSIEHINIGSAVVCCPDFCELV